MIDDLIKSARGIFFRNVLKVATGTAAAQVIAMLFTPLITRLFGPEIIGLVGILTTVVGVLATVAAMTYPIAIVLPSRDDEAKAIAMLSLGIGTIFSSAVALVLWIKGPQILKWLNAEAILGYMYVIPVFTLLSALIAVANQWLTRIKAFGQIARVTVIQSLIVNCLRLVAGYIYPVAGLLICVNGAGNLLHVGLLVTSGRREWRNRAEQSVICISGMWKLAKQYSDFPLLRAPQVFLNAMSHGLPIALLASLYGPTSVGFYVTVTAVLGVPAALVGASVSQVFYPQANEVWQSGRSLRDLVVKATLGMGLIGIWPFLVVIICGPWLFSLVFGVAWEAAGAYAQWLAVWMFFGYINKPAVAVIPILKIQHGLLIYEIFSSGTKIASLMAGYYLMQSDVAAIAFFSISGALAYICLIGWVVHFAKSTK